MLGSPVLTPGPAALSLLLPIAGHPSTSTGHGEEGEGKRSSENSWGPEVQASLQKLVLPGEEPPLPGGRESSGTRHSQDLRARHRSQHRGSSTQQLVTWGWESGLLGPILHPVKLKVGIERHRARGKNAKPGATLPGFETQPCYLLADRRPWEGSLSSLCLSLLLCKQRSK